MTLDPLLPPDFIETRRIEAKLAQGRDGRGDLPDSIWETYSAFANSGGGSIYLGVKELSESHYVAVGIPDIEKVMGQFWNCLGDRNVVSHRLICDKDLVQVMTKTGNPMLIIRVPGASADIQPVYIHGDPYSGTYKRIGSSDVRCSREEVQEMLDAL